ncbi:TonB-dependent receptor [Gallaecimonas kandeliae]|uniref:TonB-dependent siderophore receptor n=1 Tax=Gallaecimonas kandeliae TaxID=3029055 RepID=UPI002648AE8F|nr:TonB-dependent receptor [Gallaecimonas kandeliae]WKE65798.1 TonB-dependent receptor [Gallaecimonas kandeliae]
MKSLSLLALAAMSALAADDSDLERITVVGRAQSLYRVDDGELATGTPTPLARTPQSLQILPQALIEDQAALQITDLYRSISGVSQNAYSAVTFRGFRQDEIRYDGVRGDPFNGFAIPQLFGIAQVQVLKGPSAALYGAGEPGGLINYVTKQPGYERDNRLQLRLGNDDFAGLGLELSGPLTTDAGQRYRLGLYQDHQNPYRFNTDDRNRILDAGYAVDFGDSTLTLQWRHIDQHLGGARLRGIPADSQGNFLADRRWNANEASDVQQLKADVLQARLDHDFNAWLSGQLTLRYFENSELQRYHEPASMTDSDGDGLADWTERQYRDQERNTQAASVTGRLVAELGDHTLLLGADGYRQEEGFHYQRANKADGVLGLSYGDPQYGVTDPVEYRLHLITDSDTRALRYGLSLQDQWRLTPAWDITGSLRLDGFNDRVLDRKSGEAQQHDDSGFSYRLGSTYRLSDRLHPYLSWSTGFVPQAPGNQLAAKGGPFEPEQSRQWEAGLRSYWLDGAINLNLAAYRIVRRNILQTDPQDTDKLQALGKVRSQGLEMDLLGDLSDNWVLNLSYAYNDTRVLEASSGISRAFGDRFANAPRHQLGLWTRYDISAWDSAIAFGADHVSEQVNQEGQRIKAYTVFDASWQSRWRAWLVQLNLKNLFDKTYAVSGLIDRTGQFAGEHRRLYLTASYRF